MAACCCRWAFGNFAAYGSARDTRYCYARVTATATGLDADLDLIDVHGAVLLTARGLQMGTGASESGNRDRLLGESLLTIDWQPQALPRRPTSRSVNGCWSTLPMTPTCCRMTLTTPSN